jgi:PAS domain S-box-containing protein
MANERIQIVEDETIIALNIQNMLKTMGYTVVGTASNGEDAIRKAGDLKPDLVLMDIRLAGEMDGVEAAGQIRSKFNIPVVYLTAYADDETLQRAKITEPFGYLIKPFEGRELYTTIEIALYKHRMDRKIRDNERWLNTILRSISDAIIATDKNGIVTFMNPIAESLTGWKQEDAAGKSLDSVFNIISEDTGAPIENTAVRVLKEGASTGLIDRTLLLSKDGQKTPVDHVTAPIIENASMIGTVLIFRDITERRKAEEKLRSKNRDLEIISSIASSINKSSNVREMLDDSLHGIMELIDVDAGAVYLYNSDVSSQMSLVASASRNEQGKKAKFKQTAASMFYREQKVYFNEGRNERFGDILEEAPTASSLPVYVKDRMIGVMAFYSSRPETARSDKARELLSIGSQIGIALENYRLFKNIENTSRYLSDVIDGSPDSMVITDSDGKVLSLNKSAIRLLRYGKDEAIGKKIAEILPISPDSELGIDKSYIKEYVLKDGRHATLNISTNKLYRDDAKSNYIITVKDLSGISGINIVPLAEKTEEAGKLYSLEPGYMYLYNKRKGSHYMDVFSDQVKHNIQGLCITRHNPERIRKQYGIEKTPIIWLTENDGDKEETCIKPENINVLAATIKKFISDANDGFVLLDGMEYILMKNGYGAFQRFVNTINDRVMKSKCRVLFCIDTQALHDRQYHLILSEMREFDDIGTFATADSQDIFMDKFRLERYLMEKK